MTNHATNPATEPATRTRLVLTFDGSTLVSTQILRNNEHVLNLDEFRTLLQKAGFAIVPKAVADYLNGAAAAMGVQHG